MKKTIALTYSIATGLLALFSFIFGLVILFKQPYLTALQNDKMFGMFGLIGLLFTLMFMYSERLRTNKYN
jgi:hypothetical protein